MVNRFRFLIVFYCCLATRVAAGSLPWLDKIVDGAMRLPAIGAPMITYAPETNWAFGGAVQGYFRCEGQKESSMVQLTGGTRRQKELSMPVRNGRGSSCMMQGIATTPI